MALRYVVKKRMIGFGKEKTEKYVARILLPIRLISRICVMRFLKWEWFPAERSSLYSMH